MIFAEFPLDQCEGALLVHSQRVGAEMFRKGRVLSPADVAALREDWIAVLMRSARDPAVSPGVQLNSVGAALAVHKGLAPGPLPPELADVASQHESVSLTDPATHLDYLDRFARLEAEILAKAAGDDLDAADCHLEPRQQEYDRGARRPHHLRPRRGRGPAAHQHPVQELLRLYPLSLRLAGPQLGDPLAEIRRGAGHHR